MFPEISHHRNFQYFFPENFLENRRVFFEFGEKAPESSGIDFLKKSEMGEKFEEKETIDVQSKLGFLKQKISLSQSEKIKTLENTSEIFQTLFEMPEGVENYGLRKKTFENNKPEILAFAEKSFQPFELKQLKNFTEFSGAKLQNIALKRWLKAQIFNPESHILEAKEREKNTITEQYSEEYFLNPKNTINKEDLTALANFNSYTSDASKKNHGPFLGENSPENNSVRYERALRDLHSNMQKKGEIMRKDSLIVISDIKKNRIIVRQRGKKDWVIPSVYGLSIGNVPGSRATPSGSFKLKTRSIPGKGKPASSTPNITGAAISLYGLESSNRNSFGRGILIHGIPGVSEDDIVSRANTHGCTGLTEEDAIKLAYRVQSAPSAYMQQIT